MSDPAPHFVDAPLDSLSDHELVERDAWWLRRAGERLGELYRNVALSKVNEGRLYYYRKHGRRMPFRHALPPEAG